ncbi:hypothetical protein GSI_12037 [Ganoderma sinense ZZ0214-1]|uniref:BTB domain-containing protein n=1 Tax=Ganoderma sinense ZZ0214-1 TaxID=1077348 RepID=A0A2G8RXN9_9APHY|nr:hypothetical protein GSI_12037 [Ganoderma sinense ZZ0214-1]
MSTRVTQDESRAVGDTKAGGDGNTGNGETCNKDTEFWFHDGTVILVARNVEFRVYEGLLAELSPVFKEIFEADGHPVRNVRMGKVQDFPCPVVHVSDSPEDLRCLLRACLSKRLSCLYDEQYPPYNDISAAIRLGDKYKITQLYSQALDYLKFYFPSSFNNWRELKDYTPPGWEKFEQIGVINLARLTGELSLLPSAFIACVWAESGKPELEGIGHGFTKEDGTRDLLSPGDLTVCFEAQSRLCRAAITTAMRTFKPVASPECKMPAACKKALRNVLLSLEQKVDEPVSGDPFTPYDHFVTAPGGLAVCPPCTDMVLERSKKERKAVWDRLPELLRIEVPGWVKEPQALPPPPQSQSGAK